MCFAVISLLGCATSKEITPEKLSHFVKGKTTYADVVKELGEPDSTILNADGSKTVSYISIKYDSKVHIPVVGPFIANQPTATGVGFNFDKKSILR
jgi:hypothetical protein